MLPFDTQSTNKSTDHTSSFPSTAISFPSSSPGSSALVSPAAPSSEKTAVNSFKYVNVALPESKSEDVFPNHLLFSCDIQCIHSIKYSLQESKEYKQFDLDKLDVILSPSSTLTIQCIFLLNGIENVLEFPFWVLKPLNKVMQNSGFRHASNTGDTFQYHVNKAFVTSPLSYLFDKQAPFGVLEKLEIVFDWSTSKPKEFQACWKRKLDLDSLQEYMEYAFTSILSRKSFCLYPLIFSSFYTKRITQTMAYLPYIAQSLQKIYTTSKATMSVSNHEFSESLMENVKTIHENTKIMNPHFPQTNSDQDLTAGQMTTAFTLGMYHSIKNANKSVNSPAILGVVAKQYSIETVWKDAKPTQRSLYRGSIMVHYLFNIFFL